jgi:glycosyltransferase involved in cell wall biosynthesis
MPIRVLSIAHPAVSRERGRLRYYPLAARQDLDLHLVVPARWQEFGRRMIADPPNDPGLNVHVLPIRFPHAGPMSWYLHFYPGLNRLVSELRPDVIHLWEEPWSAVALQASFLKGAAALVMEVDQNILKRLPPPFEWMRRHVIRRTDFVLARSPDAAAVVQAIGYQGPVRPIGYGVDRQTFACRRSPLATQSRTTQLRIGYVGRIVEEKGLDDALDAIARTESQVTLSIMGEGPYEGRLRRRAAALGLADRVEMRGWGPPAEVASFLHSLDVLILLTRTTASVVEQFGRVIVEAQSCGIPVIGSSCGAIPSVVGAGGWIVPERSPEKLAALLDRIANDRDTLRAKAQLAQRNVSTRFTYEVVADDLATAWTQAAARRGGGEADTRCAA